MINNNISREIIAEKSNSYFRSDNIYHYIQNVTVIMLYGSLLVKSDRSAFCLFVFCPYWFNPSVIKSYWFLPNGVGGCMKEGLAQGVINAGTCTGSILPRLCAHLGGNKKKKKKKSAALRIDGNTFSIEKEGFWFM